MLLTPPFLPYEVGCLEAVSDRPHIRALTRTQTSTLCAWPNLCLPAVAAAHKTTNGAHLARSPGLRRTLCYQQPTSSRWRCPVATQSQDPHASSPPPSPAAAAQPLILTTTPTRRLWRHGSAGRVGQGLAVWPDAAKLGGLSHLFRHRKLTPLACGSPKAQESARKRSVGCLKRIGDLGAVATCCAEWGCWPRWKRNRPCVTRRTHVPGLPAPLIANLPQGLSRSPTASFGPGGLRSCSRAEKLKGRHTQAHNAPCHKQLDVAVVLRILASRPRGGPLRSCPKFDAHVESPDRSLVWVERARLYTCDLHATAGLAFGLAFSSLRLRLVFESVPARVKH